MRAVWLALALLLAPLALAPATAQNGGVRATTAAPALASATNGKRAPAEPREQELAQRNAILEAKAELEDEAYSRLEILIGAFGVLITAIVIYFSMRTVGVAEAVARKEIQTAREEFASLLEQERKTVAAIKQQLSDATTLVGGMTALHDDARTRAEAIQTSKARTDEILASLEQQARAGGKPKVTEEVRVALEETNEAAKNTAQNKWTADQFRAAISKARFVDEDWQRAADLAEDMARLHGEDDADYAYAMNVLGDVAQMQGKFSAAVVPYQRVIKRLDQASSDTHRRDLAWALHHAGISLARSGQSLAAEPLIARGLDLITELDGSESSNALTSRQVLGSVMLNQSRAAEAEAEFRAILPKKEKVDGPQASNTLATRHELARAILDQSRASEAEAELRALLPLKEKVDGPEASNTLSTRHELARAMINQGRATEAEAELRVLLPLKERVDGPEASNTLATRHELARAMINQGRATEAEAELRAILLLKEKVDGPEAITTRATRHELARAILDQGRAAEAEAEFRAILQLSEMAAGPKASSTLVTRHELARAMFEQGRTAEAEAEFRAILPLKEIVVGPDASSTLVTKYWCAFALQANGDPAGAQVILDEVLDRSDCADWHPISAARLAYVRGKVADALDRREQATVHLIESRRIYSEHFPKDYYPRSQLEDYITQRGGIDA